VGWAGGRGGGLSSVFVVAGVLDGRLAVGLGVAQLSEGVGAEMIGLHPTVRV